MSDDALPKLAPPLAAEEAAVARHQLADKHECVEGCYAVAYHVGDKLTSVAGSLRRDELTPQVGNLLVLLVYLALKLILLQLDVFQGVVALCSVGHCQEKL